MKPISLNFKELSEIVSFADANPVLWKNISESIEELYEIEDSFDKQCAKVLSLLLVCPELLPLQTLSV